MADSHICLTYTVWYYFYKIYYTKFLCTICQKKVWSNIWLSIILSIQKVILEMMFPPLVFSNVNLAHLKSFQVFETHFACVQYIYIPVCSLYENSVWRSIILTHPRILSPFAPVKVPHGNTSAIERFPCCQDGCVAVNFLLSSFPFSRTKWNKSKQRVEQRRIVLYWTVSVCSCHRRNSSYPALSVKIHPPDTQLKQQRGGYPA